MPRISFTSTWHSKIKAPAPRPDGTVRQEFYSDESTEGLVLCVSSNDVWSWQAACRVLRDGKWTATRFPLGRYRTGSSPIGMTLAAARIEAERITSMCKAGQDPREAKRAAAAQQVERSASTFDAIAADFIKRYAQKRQRSWRETARILGVVIGEDDQPTSGAIPGVDYCASLRGRPIASIRRPDITRVLDKVEDDHGPVMADRVLAAVRKLFNWYAARDDKFLSPMVIGMARTKPKERARRRVLSDDEIRALWSVTASIKPPVYGSLVRFLLMTGQRRDEAASAMWNEIAGDTWTIPAARYKTGIANVVPLTRAALDVLAGVTKRGDHCFMAKATTPFNGFTKSKKALDAALLAELQKTDPKARIEPWVLHDLRRTARTLMSRRGVRREIAERVLGHVIAGVEGVYDRHDYIAEKRQALDALSAEIHNILHPSPANVVSLPLQQQAS